MLNSISKFFVTIFMAISLKSTQTEKFCIPARGLFYDKKQFIEIWAGFQATFQRGEGLPCPFSRNGKKCPNFGKNAQIVVICGLDFWFKMQFLRVSGEKNLEMFPAGPFFHVLYMIIYQSALIPRKLSCPEKFLVTRLVLSVIPLKNLSLLISVPS